MYIYGCWLYWGYKGSFERDVFKGVEASFQSMGLLRLVGSLKLSVSLAEYSLFYRGFLVASANVETVFSGAGRLSMKSHCLGPQLLSDYAFLHYNYKYDWLRPTLEEIIYIYIYIYNSCDTQTLKSLCVANKRTHTHTHTHTHIIYMQSRDIHTAISNRVATFVNTIEKQSITKTKLSFWMFVGVICCFLCLQYTPFANELASPRR